MARLFVSFLSVAILLLAACAKSPAQTPPSAATSQPQVSPEVEKILDRGESAGAKALSLRAKMEYVRNQTLVGDITKRKGSIAYLKRIETGPKGDTERVYFRVQFDTLERDDYVSTKKEVYSFDGRILHELNESTKLLVHREVVPPGEVLNPMRLGQGPFPAPFGQKKQDVLSNFSVKLIPTTDKDPKGTDHLELKPLPGTDLVKKYKKVHLFVSRDLDLPIRMITEGTSDEIVTVDFTDIELNPKKLGEKDFELAKPSGYDEKTEKLDKD
ncbi:MAG: hypothetical protein PHU85_20380 [Phycisphaerae bacterium]|nr:hypothetical protein [Phycisphaerae bacterium]